MSKIKIMRTHSLLTETIGVMSIDGIPAYWTLELPDKLNAVDISRIPNGIYLYEHHVSPNHGRCIRVIDVPGRTKIRIHKGNTHSDIRGCIIVGMQAGKIGGKVAVLNSTVAVNHLLDNTLSLGTIEIEGIYRVVNHDRV